VKYKQFTRLTCQSSNKKGTEKLMDTEKRREHLLTAAAAAFARKGYHQTSIADIMKEADIARGTVYLYFTNKEAIFHALINRWFEEIDAVHQQSREVLGEKGESPDIGRFMRDNLHRWFVFFHERRDLTQLVFREAVSIDSHFTERMQSLTKHGNQQRRDLLVHLQEIGYLRGDIPVDILNTCLNSIFREVVLEHILPYEKPDLDSLVEQVQKFIEDGAKNAK
jgi:AcrR family transcriptional regulator